MVHLYLVQHANKMIVKKDNIVQQKILSNAAQAIINADIKLGTHVTKGGQVEPPYIAPSTDVNLYSSVHVFYNLTQIRPLIC